MKQYLLLLIGFGCFLGACTGNTEEVTDQGREVQDIRVIDSTSSLAGCYTAIHDKDTSELVLQHLGGAESVSGELQITNFQKDKNTGTINGVVKDDLIVGWYKFFSEGKSSVRQIVFKIDGDNLLEGYGDTTINGDTIVFKSIVALNYLNDIPFVKRECE